MTATQRRAQALIRKQQRLLTSLISLTSGTPRAGTGPALQTKLEAAREEMITRCRELATAFDELITEAGKEPTPANHKTGRATSRTTRAKAGAT